VTGGSGGGTGAGAASAGGGSGIAAGGGGGGGGGDTVRQADKATIKAVSGSRHLITRIHFGVPLPVNSLPVQLRRRVEVYRSHSRLNRCHRAPCDMTAGADTCLSSMTCYRFSAMRPRDTSAKAAAIQDQLHDAMGPEGRFQLAMRMSELAREFAKAGIRDRHPQLADDDILIELRNIFYSKRVRP